MEFILFLLLFFLVPFLLQLLILHRTRKRLKPLRWVVLLGVVVLLADAWRVYHEPTGFFSFGALAAIFDLVLAGCVLLGWGAAWGIFAIRNRRKEKLP